MAFIQEHRPSRWRVRFSIGQQRFSIHLPKGVSTRERNRFRERIEELITCKSINAAYPPDLMVWLNGLQHDLLEKLAAASLVTYSITPDLTLIEIVDQYIERRKTRVSNPTVKVWGQTRRILNTFFGPILLKDITIGQASDFAENVPGAESSKRQYVATVKRMVKDAVDREIVDSNPFEKLSGATVANPERARFVERATIERLLEFCTDDETRLIIALSRYGGLRNPSEVNNLEWQDIIWDDRIIIKPQKTAKREIPFFPELVPHLRTAFESAADGAIHVIETRVTGGYTPRVQTALRRAGLTPWPRLFHNLRASRQTELSETYPQHVVCKWLGNSQQIAMTNYLQVTDTHFQSATNADKGADRPETKDRATQ